MAAALTLPACRLGPSLSRGEGEGLYTDARHSTAAERRLSRVGSAVIPIQSGSRDRQRLAPRARRRASRQLRPALQPRRDSGRGPPSRLGCAGRRRSPAIASPEQENGGSPPRLPPPSSRSKWRRHPPVKARSARPPGTRPDPATSVGAGRNKDLPENSRHGPPKRHRRERVRHRDRLRHGCAGGPNHRLARCQVRCRRRGFPIASPIHVTFPTPPMLSTAIGFGRLAASAAWYSGASGAPSPPAAMSAERKSVDDVQPKPARQQCAVADLPGAPFGRAMQDRVAVESDDVDCCSRVRAQEMLDGVAMKPRSTPLRSRLRGRCRRGWTAASRENPDG